MDKITIKEYRAANGGDYDCYKLSDGRKYWLWLKSPFRRTDMALVHIVFDVDKDLGYVEIEKDIDTIKMSWNGKQIETKNTMKQWMRPNKKYYFDKIVRYFLMK